MTTGRAAGQAAGDTGTHRALEALRLAWGDAYDIGSERGTWTATSRDTEARTFTGRRTR